MRIVVCEGHRNTTRGDDNEMARTPRLAKALVAELRGRGHDTLNVQNDDGSADDWFDGTLDAVALRVMKYDRDKPVDLMLDLHIAAPQEARGVCAIYPDGDGLQTLTPYDGSDSTNTRDQAWGAKIAAGISHRTGLALRTVAAPGLMSEKQTGVGADLGWRLAMFGYTVGARDHMVRLVIEHGNIGADRAILDGAGFAGANAVAIADALGGAGQETGQAFGTITRLAAPQRVTVTEHETGPRQYGETSFKPLAVWPVGTQFTATGFVVGEAVAGNPIWWITADKGWRVWSGACDRRELLGVSR